MKIHPALKNLYLHAETLMKSVVQSDHDRGLRIKQILDRLNILLKDK